MSEALVADEDLLAATRRRIAQRIWNAMRDRGLSSVLAEASKTLAQTLGWETSAVVHLLSGQVTPRLEDLLLIASVLQVPLSNLLSEEEPFPPGTMRIRAAEAGEDLVIKLPSQHITESHAARGLVHYLALTDLGFGVEDGDRVIATQSLPAGRPTPGVLYLFRDQNGEFGLRFCDSARNTRATLRNRDGTAVTMILGKTTAEDGFVMGEVVAVLRSGSSMHRRATAALNASTTPQDI